MKNNPIELLQGRNGKLSRTALMFLIWMTFLMTLIGYVTFKEEKLADLPEAYVYLTVVLCGTYTARRYLDGKFTPRPTPTPEPPTPPVPTPIPAPVTGPVFTPP